MDAATFDLVEALGAERGLGLAVVERTGRRGEMTPLHVHPEDELVYVVEGALTLFVDDEPVRLDAGDAFAAPRATPHTLAVASREVRYLSATVARSAARYEDFLRAVAVPAEASSSSWEESGDASRLAAIAAPNGIEVLGAPGATVGKPGVGKGLAMAYGVVHRFKGGKKEQYEASLAKVHPNQGADLPEGQTLHIAGPTDDGWIIVAIHESRESWERFRDDTLGPGLQELGDAGFAGPPDETTFEVDKLQRT